MDGKIYPGIKNSILLCLLFLGIQIGLGILIGVSRAIFNISDISLIKSRLKKYKPILVPIVFIGLGVYIIFESNVINKLL
jgi:cadmium resistance protein CadD (predicted permease)